MLEVTQAALLEAETSLAGELRSAGEARRFVDETLRRWDCADLLDTVKLLISEMVTNAVVHAGSDVDVCVQLTDRVVRVSVFDDSPQQPVVKRAAAEETSGRGMALVDAMSSGWGVEPTFKGKRVWFELPRPDLRQG